MTKKNAHVATLDPPARKWSAAADAVATAFSASGDSEAPVYLRLKRCVAALVLSGELPAQAQLPPEQWLAKSLGVSLGTAQKALNALNAEGYVERRQGHGTYVAAPRRPMQELWHFRFLDPETERFAPVFSHLLSRRIVEDERAARLLGPDPAGFVRIERMIEAGEPGAGGTLSCHSRIWLGASHFAPLMEIEASVFENVNLKAIFSSRFGRPTLDATQRVRLAPPNPEAQAALGLPADEMTLTLTVIARSHGGAYSFQEAHIPRSRYLLDLSPPAVERR